MAAANKLLTLVFVCDGERVLLGYKKRGFGAGRWNGFGGKVQQGESIEDGAKRELEEECGVVAKELIPAGILVFDMIDEPPLLEVHVYRVVSFEGTPTESEEMLPKWFHRTEVPFDVMWPDDKLWYPYLFEEKPFYGYFIFIGTKTYTEYTLNEVKDVAAVDIPTSPVGNLHLLPGYGKNSDI